MKRTVSVIHEGDTTEVQWSRSEPETPEIDGYVQLDDQGRLIVPFHNSYDEAFVFVLGPEGAVVYETEDACAEQPDDVPVAWWADAGDR